MSDDGIIEFNFAWKALKLLGKSLYSNVWSAISELVANGIDAGASKVSVLIDARNKHSATIEIMDDGEGMDSAALHNYVKIGFDRRRAAAEEGQPAPSSLMGRKGIGKLAALYLSNDYDILTKTETGSGQTCWNLKYRDGLEDDEGETKPGLRRVPKPPHVITKEWDAKETKHGTLLQLRNVDLRNLGAAAYEQLGIRLANQFLTTSLHTTSIETCFITTNKEAESLEFSPVKKAIAFDNFAYIMQHFPSKNDDVSEEKNDDVSEEKNDDVSEEKNDDVSEEKNNDMPEEIKKIEENEQNIDETGEKGQNQLLYNNSIRTVSIPYRKSENASYKHIPRVEAMSGQLEGTLTVSDRSQRIEQSASGKVDGEENDSIPYQLTGWIGIHATIDETAAKENDPLFEKGKWYKPNSLRLYVRNKLAEENLLDKLGIHQAFLNYIEGEISFDVLDDDRLPDIATSSRQGFNELDERWKILTGIVTTQVRELIHKRQHLADEQKKTLTQRRSSIETNAKTQATKAFRSSISHLGGMSQDNIDKTTGIFAQEMKGEIDVKAKEDYIIFLSHSSRDKRIADFIFEYLCSIGAEPNEFFYTSSNDNTALSSSTDPLYTQIKKNIVSHNALVVYVISPNFLNSDDAMFEAGAGWATKTVEEYQILTVRHEDIPNCLCRKELYTPPMTNGKGVITLKDGNYPEMVRLLNILIKHLNKGRKIKHKELLKLIDEPKTKMTELELKEAKKTEQDFWDPEVRKYWINYVEKGISTSDEPLASYQHRLSETRKSRDTYKRKLGKVWS